MEKREFKIKKREDLTFRTAFKSGIELLSLQLVMDFNNIEKTTDCINWLLERVEVYYVNQWVPVKESKFDVFNPPALENDLVSQQQIVFYMLKYIKEVFQQSNESSQEQQ